MVYKLRKIDKEYIRLIDGFPNDVTYRHLAIVMFLLSIPIVGNLAAFVLGIQCLLQKK